MTSSPYAEVIGDPVKHSKSPSIHNFWLEKLGIRGNYRTAHVTSETLSDYLENRATDSDWRGCNITIPHKVAVLDLVEDRGDVRGSIGAMNTILREGDGTLIGTNTDSAGFFAPLGETDLTDQPVIVIGAGGAARAVLFALARMNVGTVTILNRSPLKAMGLLAQFGLKGDVLALDAVLPPAALLVNTSPLGMAGQPPLDLDLTPLPDDSIVYDIVYSPLETALLKQARVRDLDTIDGLEMLIGQAALAFELFFGKSPPRDCDEELRALLTA